MYSISAYNPNTGNTVIVENFIEKKDKEKSLKYWRENGMSFVTYKYQRSLIASDIFSGQGKVAKEKRNCKQTKNQ